MSTFIQECDVPGWSTPAGEPPWAALRSFARGLSAGREGDHALARRSFADVLRDFPHCPAVHYNVGVAYHRLAALHAAQADAGGEEGEAHKDGSRFLEAAADSYRAAINLGDGAHFTASALDEPALGNLRVLRAGSSSSPPLPPLPPLQSEPSSSTATAAAAATATSSITTATATERNTRDPRNTLTTVAGAAIYDRTTVGWSEDMRCQHVTYVRASSWDSFPSFSSSASG